MHDENDEPHVFPLGRRPGELLFAALILIFALILLAQIGWQTTWLAKKGLAAQPRFWPALSLVGMVVFAAALWLKTQRTSRTPGRWKEAALWVRSLEFAGWYVLYVIGIPIVGYLLATLTFCVFLTLRLGYRNRMYIYSAIGFALFVVLVFKTGFNVKIPGGALYELAPDGLRYFLIRYF